MAIRRLLQACLDRQWVLSATAQRSALYHAMSCVLQDNAESGLVGKVQRFVTDGIKWLTTGRKRRGVLTSMQGEHQ